MRRKGFLAQPAPRAQGQVRLLYEAVRRARLFLVLSLLGVGVAGGLAVYYGYRRLLDPDYPLGVRGVLVLLILLNARMNLRQYRYGRALAPLLQSPLSPAEKDERSDPGTPADPA